mmetsp:Transcript_5468/g.15821  ORF Transcript_5468/g.15821 Transcript_5468/m.15821 type:complete len:340 (+) Transcript_5468:975-1994(+)
MTIAHQLLEAAIPHCHPRCVEILRVHPRCPSRRANLQAATESQWQRKAPEDRGLHLSHCVVQRSGQGGEVHTLAVRRRLKLGLCRCLHRMREHPGQDALPGIRALPIEEDPMQPKLHDNSFAHPPDAPLLRRRHRSDTGRVGGSCLLLAALAMIGRLRSSANAPLNVHQHGAQHSPRPFPQQLARLLARLPESSLRDVAGAAEEQAPAPRGLRTPQQRVREVPKALLSQDVVRLSDVLPLLLLLVLLLSLLGCLCLAPARCRGRSAHGTATARPSAGSPRSAGRNAGASLRKRHCRLGCELLVGSLHSLEAQGRNSHRQSRPLHAVWVQGEGPGQVGMP